jgi:hypothetical protein
VQPYGIAIGLAFQFSANALEYSGTKRCIFSGKSVTGLVDH